ncbi:MAG: NTP transferase domain-containing protein [Azospirillum sp.]|nr:NTP transferase domain-containing protein [Azospirillum sp.]
MAGETGLGGIDVVVLAGGLGTRLQGVLDGLPKVLAPIDGRPFLDHLIEWLAGFGAKRIVLSLGYRADKVVALLADRPAPPALVPVIEPAPLGTAGAVRFVRPMVTSSTALVLNGDSFVDADLGEFARRHLASGVDFSLLCVEVPNVDRFGSIELDDQGFVARFVEKDPSRRGPGLISAGIYLLSATALDRIVARSGPSLERDILQQLPPRSIRAEVVRGAFIDIGTPESLAEAPMVIPASRRPASS